MPNDWKSYRTNKKSTPLYTALIPTLSRQRQANL